MRTLGPLILILWIAFWIYWLVEARKSKKSINLYKRQGLVPRFAVLIALIIVVHVMITNSESFSYSKLSVHSPALKAIGFILFILGLAFAIWARRHIGKNWGMPMTQKAKPELVTTGPYKYVRHPIYTGVLLGITGTAIAVNFYWLIILVAQAFYFIYSAMQEEKYLTKEFPKDYPKYKMHSKMLIPFIF